MVFRRPGRQGRLWAELSIKGTNWPRPTDVTPLVPTEVPHLAVAAAAACLTSAHRARVYPGSGHLRRWGCQAVVNGKVRRRGAVRTIVIVEMLEAIDQRFESANVTSTVRERHRLTPSLLPTLLPGKVSDP
jgi:hypothetical protein